MMPRIAAFLEPVAEAVVVASAFFALIYSNEIAAVVRAVWESM